MGLTTKMEMGLTTKMEMEMEILETKSSYEGD